MSSEAVDGCPSSSSDAQKVTGHSSAQLHLVDCAFSKGLDQRSLPTYMFL